MYIEVYQKMVSTCIKLEKYQKAFEYAERARSRVFAEMLSEKIPENKTISNTILSPNLLKDPSESILYYFVAYSDEIVGLLINQGQIKSAKSLGNLHEIRSDIRTILENSKDIEGLPENSINALYNIYQKLIQPFESHLMEDIIIIPHRELHYIPFAALWDGKLYLIEKHSIKLAPSATSLKLLKTREYPNKKALILGNPTTDLEWAEDEAKIVEKILKEKQTYEDVVILLREDATTNNLKKEINTANLVHYSGHAFFDWAQPENSGLILNDGVFTIKDIAELHIPANLVVLSACETGLAKISPGDELEGLVRAIQLAGTRYVIATLWPVNDYIARKIFEIFYLEKGSIAEKLKSSQEKIIKLYKENIGEKSFWYWAPFQIYGG
ncbi:CHAT domain-containing protein [Thermococcus prieurii]